MISRASLRNLKHRAKKSVLIKIGRTSSSQEDPAFKELLANVKLVRSELKNMHQSARLVVVTGRQHNDSLEKLCGAGLKGEDMFNKEDVFLRVLEDRVCLALNNIISKDLETLGESIVEYKTAKLKFDTAYFKAQKNMKKTDSEFVENFDEIMQSNTELLPLKENYDASKDKVISQRDVLLSHLNKRVTKSLEELSEASDMQHHQMYSQYIREKLMTISKICTEGRKGRSQSMIVSKRPTTETRKDRARSNDLFMVEDEKMMIDTRLLEEVENKEMETEQSEGVKNSVPIEVQAEQKDEIPATKTPKIGDVKVDRMLGEMSASPREESL